MGSKNLKAVVVNGNEKISYADDQGFKALNKKLTDDVREHPKAKLRYDLGTMMWIPHGTGDRCVFAYAEFSKRLVRRL